MLTARPAIWRNYNMSDKKDIYELNMKGMRELLVKFNKTLFGKTIFFLAYLIPLVTFLVMLCLGVKCIINPDINLIYIVAMLFGIFLVTFTLGNICYYKELRAFSEKH